MLKILRRFFRESPRIHLRQKSPDNLRDLVGLFDRFLDGTLGYDLEWDDFISWSNPNPNIEAIRERIADAEPLFFSKHERDRRQAVGLLLEERNQAAALIGLEIRTFKWPEEHLKGLLPD